MRNNVLPNCYSGKNLLLFYFTKESLELFVFPPERGGNYEFSESVDREAGLLCST
jgi:hypothetical protein